MITEIPKSLFNAEILVKRQRTATSTSRQIVVYDSEQMNSLGELCRKEGTNISSVICNLCERFVGSIDSPQKTIVSFSKKMPDIDASPSDWRKYLNSLNRDEYKQLDNFLNTILYLHNQRGREF